MKVILTTNIKKIGKIGDLVDVKNGYARNFLFPNKMELREYLWGLRLLTIKLYHF